MAFPQRQMEEQTDHLIIYLRMSCAMNKRFLGNIEVSPIGMGCMGFSHGYGEIPPEGYAVEAIRKAYDFGCTFFDTAESYGPNRLPENRGHNERIVGKTLKDVRKQVVLATKLHLDASEMTPDGTVDAAVRRHLTASLERLRTDYVDLYYLHRVNRAVPVTSVAKAMGRLIGEGLIRGWGLSQVDVDTIDEAQQVTPLSAVQNIYSMVERGIEEKVIPYCQEHRIGLVPFSPIASGLLSGKIKAGETFSHSDDVRKFVPQLSDENLKANRPIIDLISGYAEAKGATNAQICLAWMLHKYPNVVPIPGSKNQARILENLGAWNIALTDKEFQDLDQALSTIPVAGHRGFVQFEGDSMSDWDKKN